MTLNTVEGNAGITAKLLRSEAKDLTYATAGEEPHEKINDMAAAVRDHRKGEGRALKRILDEGLTPPERKWLDSAIHTGPVKPGVLPPLPAPEIARRLLAVSKGETPADRARHLASAIAGSLDSKRGALRAAIDHGLPENEQRLLRYNLGEPPTPQRTAELGAIAQQLVEANKGEKLSEMVDIFMNAAESLPGPEPEALRAAILDSLNKEGMSYERDTIMANPPTLRHGIKETAGGDPEMYKFLMQFHYPDNPDRLGI